MSGKKNIIVTSGTTILFILMVLFLSAGGTKPKEEVTPEAEKVITITVWDQFGYEGATAAGPAMDKLEAIYEERHPNINIERTFISDMKIRDQLRIAVAGGTEPDMFYTWPAAAVLASYAKDGKLVDLTEAANKYGWFDKLPELEIKRCSYKGKLYAFPTEQDYMLVYYNKDLFKDLGLSVPTTYNKFLNLCEDIKRKDYIPIAFGNSGKWPATNTLSLIMANTAGIKLEEEVLHGDTPWLNEGFLKSCEVFIDWADRGFFPKGFNGISYEEANSLFTMGEAVMNITGAWMIEDFLKVDFELGFFMLPSINPDLPQATMMGEGSQWSIASRASKEVQEEAIKFLDFLMSSENYELWVEEGSVIPIVKGSLNWEEYDVPQFIKNLMRAGDKMANVNGYDLHTTTPESFTEVLYNNLQLMLDKKVTPEQCLKTFTQAWETSKEAGEIWVP